MSECKLDHSTDDVLKKLAEQAPHLPPGMETHLKGLLARSLHQEKLNVLFHLLKKYDLSDPQERKRRDQEMVTFSV
jgi:hypothetical protein